MESAGIDRSQRQWNLKRDAINENLSRLGGRHLVLVRDVPENGNVQDWVYNAADIDSSPIVWARSSGDEQTPRLTEYFSDRRAWQTRLSGHEVELVPVLDVPSSIDGGR